MQLSAIEPDPGQIKKVFGRLVNNSTGLINHVECIPIESGTPNFFHFAAEAADTGVFSAQKNFANTGGASSFRSVALAKAAGEAIERYSAALYEQDSFPLASYDEASFACADPLDFALHSEGQYATPGFPWLPFTRSTPVRWTPALELNGLKAVHVPAAFTWIPYVYRQGSGDSPVGQPISTGLACHETLERSALSGLFEVVERDAFTIMWQARLSMPQIRIETLSDANYDLVQRFTQTGDQVYLLNITMGTGINTVLSVLVSDQPERPAFVFAASAHADPEKAVRKALEELAHTRRYSQQIKDYLPPIEDPEQAELIQTQVDHLNFAGDHQYRDLLAFVLDSSERLDFEDLHPVQELTARETLIQLVQKIDELGHKVYVADLTSPDVRELGLSVTRTLVPGFHPLFMGHNIRALGGRRLWEIPEKLGYPGLKPEQGANPYPHPYP